LPKDRALVNCSENDRRLLSSCVEFAQKLMGSDGWRALSQAHELGLFVRDWPDEAGHSWALTKSILDPMLIGASQLSLAQSKVNEQLQDQPLQGLREAGELAMLQLQNSCLESVKANSGTSSRMGVPTSGIQAEQSISKKANAMRKSKRNSDVRANSKLDETPQKKRKKSKNTPAIPVTNPDPEPNTKDDYEIPVDSPLRNTCVVGTVSAKLSYLLDRISQLYLDEKIIVFYDGNNAAWYLAQCLELLHIKHLIYAKSLDTFRRSKYVVAFDRDDSIRVLLMDIKCGAYGLNVNKASRVFFINPVCRPSTEAQAIKRAHRIGQTRPVYVETLVLNDTIEAGIFDRSSQMTETEHIEANQISYDSVVSQIIQNARLIPVGMESVAGGAQMAALARPLQIFGRPGWNDTKIHGIDQDLFAPGGGDVNGRSPRPKKAVERPPSPSADSAQQVSALHISGPQFMYTPFASRSLNGVDAVSRTNSLDPVSGPSVDAVSGDISFDPISSSVFGGNGPMPLSSRREPTAPGHTGSIKQSVFQEPVASAQSKPDQPSTQGTQTFSLEKAGSIGPWVAHSPAMVLLNGNQPDGRFENWSVDDCPREERKVIWTQGPSSTKNAERSLFGWGRDTCKY
jgi:Helicase conserved C-terminal domain